MATELSLLIPEFRKKLVTALEASKSRGFQIEPIQTLISPMEQASLWKQGRSGTDAELKTMALANAGATYLANCMTLAYPKETNVVTDDLPGFSWHQWGEATTVVWVDGSRKLNFSPTFRERPLNFNGYQIFGEECAKVGLTTLRFNCVQLRPETSPTDLYTIGQIDAEMAKRYNR